MSEQVVLERWYLEEYHPIDERIPRFRQLPDAFFPEPPNSGGVFSGPFRENCISKRKSVT